MVEIPNKKNNKFNYVIEYDKSMEDHNDEADKYLCIIKNTDTAKKNI